MSWKAFQKHVAHFSKKEQETIQRAYALGEKAHKNQKRRSGEPYFSHPIAVAEILVEWGADAETVVAALLHDTVEDTPVTLDDIEHEFGETIMKLIDGVTKLEESNVAKNLDKKVETLRKIFTLMQEDTRMIVMKLADRLHNMKTIKHMPPEKAYAMAMETKDVYVKIADRLCMRKLRGELCRLCIPVLTPEKEHAMDKMQKKRMADAKDIAHTIQKDITKDHASLGKHIECIGDRYKWDRLEELIEIGDVPIAGLPNAIVIIVCPSVDDCYKTLGVLHKLYAREVNSFQDFISDPKLSGYRGVHSTIILKDGSRARCKIRTREMQDYALMGIATQCFDSKSKGALHYIPWTQRIDSVSQDTEKRSDEFWESLQSDVLGESISIHDASDISRRIPKNCTALDAALYCFGEEALRTKTILLNGKEVLFNASVSQGDTIDIRKNRRNTVHRDWLNQVQTGFAKAKIRETLAHQSHQKQLREGKRILQQTLDEHGRGLLEEFSESRFEQSIHSMGYTSMNDIAHDIASGHLDPETAYHALFEEEDTSPDKRIWYTIRFSFPIFKFDVIRRTIDAYKEFEMHYRVGKFFFNPLTKHIKIVTYAKLTHSERPLVIAGYKNAGVQNLEVDRHTEQQTLRSLFILLVALWGLDPVLANVLLHHTVEPIDFTIVRYCTFFVSATLFYMWHITRAGLQGYKNIPIFRPSLFLASFAFFTVGFLTYMSLDRACADQYILAITIGALILPVLQRLKMKLTVQSELMVIGIAAITIGVLGLVQEKVEGGLLLCAGAGLAFGYYAYISRKYQEEEAQVHERYPSYLFWLSGIALIPTALLLPKSTLGLLPIEIIGLLVAYCLLFVFLPYLIFYKLIRRIANRNMYSQLLLVVAWTMVGELVLQRNMIPLLLLPTLAALWVWKSRRS